MGLGGGGRFVGGPGRSRLHLVELELESDVFRAVGTVVVAEAAALDFHVLAHVYAPGVVGVAGEETVVADFN